MLNILFRGISVEVAKSHFDDGGTDSRKMVDCIMAMAAR
jgi:hypothetical protein